MTSSGVSRKQFYPIQIFGLHVIFQWIDRHVILDVIREREKSRKRWQSERILGHLILSSLFGSVRLLYCTSVTIKLWASRFVVQLSCCTYCTCVQYVLNIYYCKVFLYIYLYIVSESFTKSRCIYQWIVTHLTNMYELLPSGESYMDSWLQLEMISLHTHTHKFWTICSWYTWSYFQMCVWQQEEGPDMK